jgi:peptide/nickel transport system substrate-binding protein
MTRALRFGPIVCLVLLLACGSPSGTTTARPSAGGQADGQTAAAPAINRTLVMAGRAETPSVASRPLRVFGLTSTTVSRLFNAGLALRDGEGNFRPYLAESLPQLNTDSWKLFPDGRMETTYRLKPDLVWQDGRPLTAEDFAFSFQVYKTEEIGQSTAAPIGMMDEVQALDPRTILIKWKVTNADAGNLEAGSASITNAIGFPALPKHLLETSYRAGNVEAFIAMPFWSTEYVGLGPYKMDKWEAGSHFDGVAFDKHVLGKPKIERVRMKFIPDFNTSLANMLAGEGHITVDDSIRFQQALVLRRDWEPKNAGTVLVYPALWRHTYFQQRPELAHPLSLTDVRVRKALSYTVDKDALNVGLFEGEGILVDTPIPATSASFAEVDRAAVKYPFDARRADQLMSEAGYAKAGDGFWAHPLLGRFTTELTVLQSPQNENEMHIMAATWRPAGFDVTEKVWGANLASDPELRDTHPGLGNTSAGAGAPGEIVLADHESTLVPSAANRWAGSNRGGWSNADFDRLAQRFNTTLVRSERGPILAQMARVFTEDAAVISLFYNPTTTAFVASLRGPKPAVPEGTMSWDIHEWQWAS